VIEDVAREVEAAGGQGHHYLCDHTQERAVDQLVSWALRRFGRIDVLVNASVSVIRGEPLTVDMEAFDQAIDVNLRSVLTLSQAVARKMVEAPPPEGEAGAIVNVTSIAAHRTARDLLPYSVSCAALDQLTRSMALALAPRGVRVNAVALGGVMTRGLKATLREQPDLRAPLIAATPLGRIAEAAEAAEAILFLASPGARFVTGQILAADGGRSALDPLAALTG
jgi:7-alpha-hydroxysteroid dehydrogenase